MEIEDGGEGLRDMKRKLQTNQQRLVKKPKVSVPQTTTSSPCQDSEASDKKQFKDKYPPKYKKIHKSRKPRMDLDHVNGLSVLDSIAEDGWSEEGNVEELEETVCKPKEGNNSAKGSRPTPNHFVDKITTTQRNFLCGESKEHDGDDKYEKERERQVERVSQTKDMPNFNWACLYNGTPDEDDNTSEPKDDGLKEGSGDDANDDEEGEKEDDGLNEGSWDDVNDDEREKEDDGLKEGSGDDVNDDEGKKEDDGLKKGSGDDVNDDEEGEKENDGLNEGSGDDVNDDGEGEKEDDGLKKSSGDDVNDDGEGEKEDDGLNEGSGADVNDDEGGKKVEEEESKDGTTKSKNEQENDTGSSNELQESTSKAITYVKNDNALVKTQSKPFQRVWTDEDEKTLLEAIGSYRAIHGKEPNNNKLFNIIKGKISFEPTIVQVRNKTRSLKRIKRKPRQRIIEDTPAEKSLLCSSLKVWGVNKMCSTSAQSSKGKEALKDTEIASIVMTLFQGNEGDEVMQIETSTGKVARLIASGLPTKWKDLIKAQANQYLIGLNNRKSKVELFLEMMEIEAREHDDNDTE